MYNRFCKYLTTGNILYINSLVFKQVILWIYESFETNQYTLGVFIDFSGQEFFEEVEVS